MHIMNLIEVFTLFAWAHLDWYHIHLTSHRILQHTSTGRCARAKLERLWNQPAEKNEDRAIIDDEMNSL